MALTLEYVKSLNPEFIPIPLVNQLRDSLLRGLHERLPTASGWNQPDSEIYIAMEYVAVVLVEKAKEFNEVIKLSYLAFATGAGLDARASDYGLQRFSNESDDNLRMRCINRLEGISAGTYDGIRSIIFRSVGGDITVSDVGLIEDINQQDLTVYFTPASLTIPTDLQVAALQNRVNLAMNDPIGSTLTVAKPRIQQYSFELSVFYAPEIIDRQTLLNQTRTNLYAYVGAQSKLDRAVSFAGIQDAAFQLGVTRDATLTAFESPKGLPIIGRKLSGIQVLDGGSGYDGAMTITVADPPNVQATATVQVDEDGTLSLISIDTNGTKYDPPPAAPPTVTIAAPPSGTTATATAVVEPTGVLSVINIDNGGTGYLHNSPPTVTIDPPTSGTTATATGSLSSGSLNSVTITNAGTKYDPLPTNPPVITITGDGSGATATATVGSDGTITGITPTVGGSGYSNITLTIAAPTAGTRAEASTRVGGGITGVTFTNNGQGYLELPAFELDNIGNGSGAEIKLIRGLDGTISSADVITGGTGYLPNPSGTQIIIAAPSSVFRTAKARPLLSNGVIQHILIDDAGQGYVTAPSYTIYSGTAATLGTPIIYSGGVSRIDVLTGGDLYTSAPEVTITGDGTGATATAVISSSKVIGINITSRGTGYTTASASLSGGLGTGAMLDVVMSQPELPANPAVIYTAEFNDNTIIIDMVSTA